MIRFGKDDGSSPTLAPTVRGRSRCQRLAAQVVELERKLALVDKRVDKVDMSTSHAVDMVDKPKKDWAAIKRAQRERKANV